MDTSPDPTTEAVRLFQQGVDREAQFEALMRRHVAGVEAFFRRLGCPADEVQDLRQETFRTVWLKLDGLRDPEQFASWLFSVRRTTWLQHLRNRRATKRGAEAESLENLPREPAVEGTALRELLGVEAEKALRGAVDRLPPKSRRCLELRIFQERSIAEIAILLRLAEGTVKAHLFQARKKLEEELGDLLSTA